MNIKQLERKFYPKLKDNWDDEIFRNIILRRLKPDMVILDLGAGAGIVKQMNFKRLCRRVVGLDPDKSVLSNPYLDEAVVGVGEKIPYPDEYFDIVISDNVLEHVRSPEQLFSEVRRVLKSDGLYLAKTPNRYHYMTFVAMHTPHWFHQFYNSLRGRSHDDTYPTYYRINSRSDISRWARELGFEISLFETCEGRPEYLKISSLLYLLGVLYERIVNSSKLLEKFRIVCVVVLRKTSH